MTELIDLVNFSGEIVERSVPRDDAKQHEDLYMQIVIAVIFNGLGKILVHERAKSKSVDGGKVDLVCGGLRSGETPEAGAIRETQEETGVTPKNLRVIRKGVNQYGRFCHLLVGQSNEDPSAELDPKEAAWAKYYSPQELAEAEKFGKMTFVEGFFEDIEQASAMIDAGQKLH